MKNMNNDCFESCEIEVMASFFGLIVDELFI